MSTETDFKQYEVYKATKADFSDAIPVTTITNKDATEAEAKEELNWLLIGWIIGVVVIAAAIAVAVVMLKKRKGKVG